jgi:hypothetical protein
MKNDLTTLRSQLASMDRDQGATEQQFNQLAGKMSQAGLEVTASDKEAEAAPLTPQQEREHAVAHEQTELTLMEGTVRAADDVPTRSTLWHPDGKCRMRKNALPYEVVARRLHPTRQLSQSSSPGPPGPPRASSKLTQKQDQR